MKNSQEEMVNICIDWISHQTITKTINMRRSSYGLKHVIEKWAGTYVSNDAFIEAVKLTGIPHKQLKNSPNIAVAISERSIKSVSLIPRHLTSII